MCQENKIAIDPESQKTGLMNYRGVYLITPVYDEIVKENDYYYWCRMDTAWYHVSESGEVLFQLKPGLARFPIENYLELANENICVKSNNTWYIVSRHEGSINRAEYDDMDIFEYKTLGNIMVMKNGLWGICDSHLKMILPFQYKSLGVCRDNLFAPAENIDGKYGFIDGNGNIQLDFIYDYADSFNEGVAIIQISDKYGAIDSKGNIVIPLVYDFLENNFALIHAEKDGYFWCIDFNGVLMPEYVVEKVENLNRYL